MKALLTPKRLIWLALVVLLGAGGYFFWQSRASTATLILEKTVVARKDIVINVSTTGRVQPMDQVEVGTEVSGTVAKIYTDFNQKVEKGQVLLELDRAKAASKVEQSQASYSAAETEATYLKSTLDRTQKLVQNGGATAVDLETAQYKYDAALASLIRARNDLQQAQIDLSNCTIKSPIDGVVLNREVEVGQTVAASMSTPTLFIIARDLARMQVEADVDEADIGQVKVGQKVDFTVDAYPKDSFGGVVKEVRLSATVTSNVVTYTVIIEAENPDAKLLPGMTATCNIVTQEALNVLVLPVKALQFQPTETTPGFNPPQEGDASRGPPQNAQMPAKEELKAQLKEAKAKNERPPMAWLVDAKGNLQPRPVVIGLTDGVNTEIKSGLAEGDSVATGTTSVSEAETGTSSGESSPFIPKRPSKKSSGGPPPM
jgi:HlyD family secretion protein